MKTAAKVKKAVSDRLRRCGLSWLTLTDFPQILWPRFMKVRGTFWRARRGGTEGGGRDGTRTTNEQTGLELEKEFKACDENGGGAKRAMCCIFCVSLFRCVVFFLLLRARAKVQFWEEFSSSD